MSGDATFPAQIEDCKAAVRWLRANAKKYHLNPERLGVVGFSAGAHLALHNPCRSSRLAGQAMSAMPDVPALSIVPPGFPCGGWLVSLVFQ